MARQLGGLAATRVVLAAMAAAAMLLAWGTLAGAPVLIPHQHVLTAPAFAATTAMWLTMVVAMMTPTVWPWLAAYATLVAQPGGGTPWRSVAAFASGYLAVWLPYSAGAAALHIALAHAGLLVGDRVGAIAGGGVLVAAGVFQFMPLKGACLAHCRSPLSYFLAHWHDGPIGGFRLGLSHGAFCLGCCWLMMLTALAMGVMNLAWMAALTVIVALEQIAPGGIWLGRASGVALITWGAWLLT